MTWLGGYLDHSFLEIDNNIVARSILGICLYGQIASQSPVGNDLPQNYMFVGSERGGNFAVILYALVETTKISSDNTRAGSHGFWNGSQAARPIGLRDCCHGTIRRDGALTLNFLIHFNLLFYAISPITTVDGTFIHI